MWGTVETQDVNLGWILEQYQSVMSRCRQEVLIDMCSLLLPTPTYAHKRPKPWVGEEGDSRKPSGLGTYKLTPSPAALGPSEMRLKIFFFPRMCHPTGCKGPCPLRNVKSNPEKSRHLPRKGVGGGELLSIRTQPFPAVDSSVGGWGGGGELSLRAGRRGGGEARGGREERGAAGRDRTRLASGLCVPQTPGEPRA